MVITSPDNDTEQFTFFCSWVLYDGSKFLFLFWLKTCQAKNVAVLILFFFFAVQTHKNYSTLCVEITGKAVKWRDRFKKM